MKRIGITSDCACDLPEEYFELHDVGIMYFYITTDTGRFRDGCEVDSQNIIEYLERGGIKAATCAPQPMEYEIFFGRQLEKYDEIIHISLSGKLSNSYTNARTALSFMGRDSGRVSIIDSEQFSSGMAFMIIKAVEMRDSGCSASEIIRECSRIGKCISTSFIAKNADHLYLSGLTGKTVKTLCSAMLIHPVLSLKNGHLALKALKIGDYKKSVRSYIRSELRRSGAIDRKRVFITHAGCGAEMLADVKTEVKRLCCFDEMIVEKASATILSNCGAGSIGVLFLKNK